MNKKSLLSLSMSMLLASNVNAFESVNGKDLVGQVYGGIHYSYFSVDDDRLAIEGVNNSYLNDGDGFGLELGYRLSEFNELRVQFTDMTIDAENEQYGDKDGDLLGIDILHFFQHQNLYVVGGFKEIDLDEQELTVNIGAGFRHHFTQRFAAYIEAKSHYQFDEGEKDFSASIGLMYFFGAASDKAVPMSKPVEKAQKPKQIAPVVKDTDGDGVIDSEDQCPRTPMSNKVDENGCTIFAEEEATMTLLVNFENNKAEIRPEHFQVVEDTANFMNEYKHVSLSIEGHTSSQGNAEYNKKLSGKRAQAVVDMLVTKYGIDESRLSAVGYGEEQLINTDNTAEAHAENRRIQGKISTTKKVAVKK